MRGRDKKQRPDFQAVLWIRIQWGPRIRIRNPGPDPGGQKWLTNIGKLINFIFWSAGYSLLRVEGFSCSLDKSKFSIKTFFICIFFSFWWSKLDPGIGIHLKCWIRIRIRIHSSALKKDPKMISLRGSRCVSRWKKGFLKYFNSILRHLPPLRFHCDGGCWDWKQTLETFALAVRRSNQSTASHPHSVRSHPHSARSHPHSARSHPHSARSNPWV